MLLGVNIDHIATLREARKGFEPSVVNAALVSEEAGADLITVHLREDRRHIQDEDVFLIKEKIAIPMNLEMSLADDIINQALRLIPYKVTIVPEKREEVTTEGGLNVSLYKEKLIQVIDKLKNKNILVSLFIDPSINDLTISKEVGADIIEFHTGKYANADSSQNAKEELLMIKKSVNFATSLGLESNAGHGLNYNNVLPIISIDNLKELNIGHSIISRSVFVGLKKAIVEMKLLINH
jgi:pyridoxine 5-phosphate synthase